MVVRGGMRVVWDAVRLDETRSMRHGGRRGGGGSDLGRRIGGRVGTRADTGRDGHLARRLDAGYGHGRRLRGCAHVDGHRGRAGENRLRLLLLDRLLRLLNVRRHFGHLLHLRRRLDLMDRGRNLRGIRCNLLDRLLDRLVLGRLLDRLLLNRLLNRLLHRLLHLLLDRLLRRWLDWLLDSLLLHRLLGG